MAQEYETTVYFEDKVRLKRPEITLEWCIKVIESHMMREEQPDGRIRFWGYLPELSQRALRVITLSDGVTVHNAFLDRGFKVRRKSLQPGIALDP